MNLEQALLIACIAQGVMLVGLWVNHMDLRSTTRRLAQAQAKINSNTIALLGLHNKEFDKIEARSKVTA